MPIADNAGARIAYEERGSGPPVVMIYGLGGSWRDWWEAFPAELARDHRLLLIDNRGTGDSDKPREPWTLDDMARDVLAVMDTAGVERAHVVGCSLGSRVARRLAALAPRRVRSLALLCPPNGINATPEDLKTAFFWDPAQPLVESARKAWTIVHPPAWAEAHDAELVADFERAQRNPTPGHTYHLQFAAGVTEDDLNAPLNEHDWRVLILQGDSDRLVPPANATALAAEVPRAQLEMLPGCSHNFWQHAPGEAASKLRAFLRTSDTAGGAA